MPSAPGTTGARVPKERRDCERGIEWVNKIKREERVGRREILDGGRYTRVLARCSFLAATHVIFRRWVSRSAFVSCNSSELRLDLLEPGLHVRVVPN